MRICTKGVLKWNSKTRRYEKIDSECEYIDYNGTVTECKSKSGGQTVQSNEPPGFMIPYMAGSTGVFEQAKNLYANNSPSYFQGETVAPFSGETQQALAQQTNLAQNNPYSEPSQQLTADTLAGKYLDITPQLQSQVNRILPSVNSRFGTSGRAGSGLAQAAVAEQVSNAAAGLMDQERQRQMQTLSMLPMLNQARYGDAQALAQVGSRREDLAQKQIDAAKAKFDFEQNLPYWKLQQYNSIIQPGFGIGGVSSTQQYKSPIAGAAGGALSGAALGSMVPGIGTGMGAAIGGGVGLLGGF